MIGIVLFLENPCAGWGGRDPSCNPTPWRASANQGRGVLSIDNTGHRPRALLRNISTSFQVAGVVLLGACRRQIVLHPAQAVPSSAASASRAALTLTTGPRIRRHVVKLPTRGGG